MSDVQYNVLSLDLSQGPYEDKELDIGSPHLVFTQVPSEIQVRFDRKSNPLVVVDRPGKADACNGKVIDKVYITAPIGSGIIEMQVGSDLRLDFSAADTPSREPRIREQYIPSAYGTAFNTASLLRGVSATDATGLSESVTGAVSRTTHHPSYPGWRIFNTDITTTYAWWTTVWKPWTVPIIGLLAGNLGLYDKRWEVETDLFFNLNATSVSFRFGFGQYSNQSTAANSRDTCVGFASGGGITIGGDGAGFVSANELKTVIWGTDGVGRKVYYSKSLGVGYGNAYHKLTTAVGVTSGGTPFVEWLIDGNVVDRYEGAIAFSVLVSDNTRPFVATGRNTVVTSTYDIRFGYGDGLILREYHEAA